MTAIYRDECGRSRGEGGHPRRDAIAEQVWRVDANSWEKYPVDERHAMAQTFYNVIVIADHDRFPSQKN